MRRRKASVKLALAAEADERDARERRVASLKEALGAFDPRASSSQAQGACHV